MEHNWKGKASSEYRFFLLDPEGDGWMFFKSAEERDAHAKKIIPEYFQDGWSEDVEFVCAGTVTHIMKKTNVILRPPEDEIDEEGQDNDWEYKCNYELTDI